MEANRTTLDFPDNFSEMFTFHHFWNLLGVLGNLNTLNSILKGVAERLVPVDRFLRAMPISSVDFFLKTHFKKYISFLPE
jgi:hypothetical protein